MQKEKWIDEILESVDGIKTAEAKNISWKSIQQRINTQPPNYFFETKIKWTAAAVILVFINVSVLWYINQQHTQPTNNLAVENMAKEMGMVISYNY